MIGVVSAQHKHYRRKQYCSRRSEDSIIYQTLVLAADVLFVVIVAVFAAFDGAPPSRIVDIPFDGFLEGLVKGMVTLPAQCAELVGIEGIAAVVTGAIFDVGDE